MNKNPRKFCGESNGRCKISEYYAMRIRNSNLSCRQLAKVSGLSKSEVYNIKIGKRWSHLP